MSIFITFNRFLLGHSMHNILSAKCFGVKICTKAYEIYFRTIKKYILETFLPLMIDCRPSAIANRGLELLGQELVLVLVSFGTGPNVMLL